MVTIVGGPNSRTDYHVNQGAEFFYQIEGTMNLGVQENGEARTISISVGELYLLPPGTPHAPHARPIPSAQLAIRTCGGQSMLKSLPLERLYRDSRCGGLMLPWTS
jgi:3-hydroxyanthranilate 3,4-dioxygenase